MLNLLAVSAAAWSPRPLVRPGRTLTPPSDNGLLGHPGGSDLSRQWLLQELASELLTEERAPSKQSGGDVRHTRSFPYMTRIGPVHDTYLRSFPYVSTVATPTRSAPCRMMARGKPAATTRQASRRSSSNPEVEAAQPVAAMLQGVATIVSATGAAAGALLCRQAGGAATGSWLPEAVFTRSTLRLPQAPSAAWAALAGSTVLVSHSGALVIAGFASLVIAAFAALFGVVIAAFAVSA